MRALVLCTGELGPTSAGSELPLGTGETALSRNLRLLLSHGWDRITVVGEPSLKHFVDSTNGAVSFISPKSLSSVGKGIWPEEEDDERQPVLVLAGGLVLGEETVSILSRAPSGSVVVTGADETAGAGIPSAARSDGESRVHSGIRAVVRDGQVTSIAAGDPVTGTVSLWPALVIEEALLHAWASHPGGPDTASLAKLATDTHLGEIRRPERSIHAADGRDLSKEVRILDARERQVLVGDLDLREPARELVQGGIARILLVTKPGDLADEVREMLRGYGVESVEIRADRVATRNEVIEGIQFYRQHGCQAVVSIGSYEINLAKCIQHFIASDGSISHSSDVSHFSSVPHIALPSPSGFGDEAHGFALMRDGTTDSLLWHHSMTPSRAVILTPSLAASDDPVRATVVAKTLLNAVVALRSSPDCEAVAEYASGAIRAVAENLNAYVRRDVAADAEIARAAHLSGIALSLVDSVLPDKLHISLISSLDEFSAALTRSIKELARGVTQSADIAEAARQRKALDVLINSLDVKSAKEAQSRASNLLALIAEPAEHVSGEYLTRTDLLVLARFREMARARNIRFFLYGRTLMDAQAFGKLAPWTEHVTIAMTRPQYRKLERWRDQLHSSITLDDADSRPSKGNHHPRLLLRSPEDGRPQVDVPGVEIRVLESVDDPFGTIRIASQVKIRTLHSMVLASEPRPDGARPGRLSRIAGPVGRMLGPKRLATLRSKLFSGTPRSEKAYFDPGGDAALVNCVFPGRWFGAGEEITLNHATYMAPKETIPLLDRLTSTQWRKAGTVPADHTYASRFHHQVDDDRAIATVSATPLVSVVLPVYNVEEFLPACLDSLCHQDTINYEIIAIDDGSPDGSIDILRRYEAEYPSLLRVVQKDNGGLSDARNFGLDLAKGKYVLFVDSDDIVSTSLVRLAREHAEEKDAEIVVFNHAELRDNGENVQVRWMSSKNSYGRSVHQSPELLIAAHPFAWNKLYRRSLFVESGIRYPIGQAFEDSATTFNLMLMARKIGYVDETLYFYRMDRANSITNTFDTKFYDIFKSFESILTFYRSHGYDEKFRDEIAEILRRTSFARLNSLISCDDEIAADKFLAEIYRYLETNAPGWADNRYFRKQMTNPKYSSNDRYVAMPHHEKMRAFVDSQRSSRVRSLAATSIQPTDVLISQLQQESLAILLAIDALCERHGLTYYLVEGTLLGAIRHQGFIPWDDDVDIAMPRHHYEKMLSILEQEPDGLILFHERTYPRYHLTFAKVLSSRPSKFITSHIELPDRYLGPAVDIFPLDVCSAERHLGIERNIRRLRDMLLFKVGYMSDRTKKAKYRTYHLSKVFGFRIIRREIERLYRREENSANADQIVNYASSYPVDKEKVPKEAYGEPKRVSFEGYPVPVPADWDLVLRTTYGSYMELPPPSQRKPRHRPKVRNLMDDEATETDRESATS